MIYYDSVTSSPSDTSVGRGEALGILSGEAYRLSAGEETGELLDLLLENREKINFQRAREAELLKREYDRTVKIPMDEYVEFQKLLNESENVWHRAKPENDFTAFAPFIEKTVNTLKRFSEYSGDGLDPYDDMLDRNERGMRRDSLDMFFKNLREAIVPLVRKISEKGNQPEDGFLYKAYPIQSQRLLAKYLMGVMGIDERHCALGETLHPFTLEFNKLDVRITTNYHEDMLQSSIYSVIHEGGHALYELNTGDELMYTCLARGVSMGIHESQSRLFENIIGRSRGFTELIFPKLQELFPSQLEGVTPDGFYRAVNKSVPSLYGRRRMN
jgi:carboxypeptidase Taq